MISLFAVPKPFEGSFGIIQRNAIRSWLVTHPDCEVILLGDEAGTASFAAEEGCRHVPTIARNEWGTPLIHDVFKQAQSVARFDILCYLNSDLVLTDHFASILKRFDFPKFLAVGQRWNLEVRDELDFHSPSWKSLLTAQLLKEGKPYTRAGLDYFLFSKGLYRDLPPFAIGRSLWDNWLVYKARSQKAEVIDVTPVFKVIHQDHDYPAFLMETGKAGRWQGPEAKRNLKLAGDLDYCFTTEDAQWILTEQGLKKKTIRSLRFLRNFFVLRAHKRNWQWLVGPVLLARLALRRSFRFLRDGVWHSIWER